MVSCTTVVCPLHAWKVSLETGKAASQISTPPCIETFRTRVEDGAVLVELPVMRPGKEAVPGMCIDRREPGAWRESTAL